MVTDIIENQAKFRIAGFIDDFKDKGESVFGYPIIGADKDIPKISKNIYGGIVAVGDNWARHQIVSSIKQRCPNFHFIKAVHPKSTVARGVKINEGTTVMAGAIINSHTHIGEHCIVNTNASLDHDNFIGDFVTIAPNATTGGTVSVGDYSVLSLGANVIHERNIDRHTIIGAGATVVHDISSYVVAYGTPAREIREREKGEEYL